MATTFALVVGIDKYDQVNWTIPGPCANACGAIDWLLTTDVPKRQIYAFLEPDPGDARYPALKARIDAFERAGVQVRQNGMWTDIEPFCSVELPNHRPAGSRLFVYWSGHGFTDKYDTRILVCRDYTTSLTNHAFNATHFLRQLRSSIYASFAEHIVLADVCGIRSEGFDVAREAPAHPLDDRRQLIAFATPEGQYAADQNGMGVFTTAVLACLKDVRTWPDLQRLNATLDAALAQVGQTPFLVSKGTERGLVDQRVGTVPAASGNALSQSVLAMLRPLHISDLTYRTHYRAVVAELANPALDRAQGLTGMAEELSALRDTSATGGVPYGLLSFLVRLKREAALEKPVNDWLQAHAREQGNEAATIAAVISREQLRKILFVQLPVDATGSLTQFTLDLYFRDMRMVPDVRFTPVPVATYAEFSAKFAAAVDQLRQQPEHADFEVHIFTDPPLFDRRFHLIPVNGEPLFHLCVVVLRHRERQHATTAFKTAWENQARELGPKPPAQIRVVKVPSRGGEAGVPLPKERGIWYAGFTVTPADDVSPGAIVEKQSLARCLRLGVPYLYWSHVLLPTEAAWNTLETDLQTLVSSVKRLGELPEFFTVQRNSGDLYASDATLLWDDPDFVPSLPIQGVERK